MKDVVAVLGGRNSDSPIHVELVAYGIKDAGLEMTTNVGLKAMAKALANCPPLSAERIGPASAAVWSKDNSLTLSVKIGSVTVNVIIRPEAVKIGDNADVTINEHLD